jgi:hypothetical protein
LLGSLDSKSALLKPQRPLITDDTAFFFFFCMCGVIPCGIKGVGVGR